VKKVAILLSGRGSNMVSLVEAMREPDFPAGPCIVISNVPDAPGLTKAASFGVPTAVVPHREFKGQGREAHDRAVTEKIDEAGADVVCLAGYMRVLSPWFVERYAGRIINIHPALLPAFPGLHAQRKALRHGCRVSGATVHFVDAEVDHGPIIVQAAVPVFPTDDEDALSARILQQEHRIYPLALRLLCEDRLIVKGRAVHVKGEQPEMPLSIVSPASDA